MELERFEKAKILSDEIKGLKQSLDYLQNNEEVYRLSIYFDDYSVPFCVGSKNALKVKEYIQKITEEYLFELEQQFKEL